MGTTDLIEVSVIASSSADVSLFKVRLTTSRIENGNRIAEPHVLFDNYLTP